MLHTLLCNKNCLPLGLLPYTAHLHLARQYSLGARHHSLVLDAVVSAHGVVLKQHSVPSLPRSTTRSTLARGWLRSASVSAPAFPEYVPTYTWRAQAPGTCSPASSGKLSKKHSNRLSPHRHGVGKGRGIGDNIKASGVRRSPRGGLFLHETERPRPVQPVRGPPKVLVPAARHASPGFLL